jgi:hypothetical protein
MSPNIRWMVCFLFFASHLISQESKEAEKIYEEISTRNQILNLIENRPDFLYSKIQTEISATNPDFNIEMKLSTRVKKDSLIFSNVNYMGIQAASVHLTKDKGVLLNRFMKCYMDGDAKLVADFTGVDLDLLELEELLLGLPIYFTKLEDSGLHFLPDTNSMKRVTFSGNLRTNSSEQKWVDLAYLFDDSLTYLKQLNLNIPSDSLTLEWTCEEFQDVSNYRLPQKVSVVIKRSNSIIELFLKYNAVEINVPEKIEFEIPENYEKCK